MTPTYINVYNLYNLSASSLDKGVVEVGTLVLSTASGTGAPYDIPSFRVVEIIPVLK